MLKLCTCLKVNIGVQTLIYYFVLKNLKYSSSHIVEAQNPFSHKRVNHVRPSRLRLRNDKKVNQKKDKSTVRIYHLGP